MAWGVAKKPDGTFESIGETGYWWMSTKSNLRGRSWYFNMEHGSPQVSQNIALRAYGFAVRCIRDKPETRAESVLFSLEVNAVPDDAGMFSGEGNYHYGDHVSVHAKAESGYLFAGWADQDGSVLSNTPHLQFEMPGENLVLSAIFDKVPKDDTATTVTDIEGNVYETIALGELEWMAENLRTRHYQNGSPIDYPGDSMDLWLNNRTGAMAWLNDERQNNHPHGALYNWYAVTNENGVCPNGWRVPSHEDWTHLEQFICKELNNSMCNIRFPLDDNTSGWRGANEGRALKVASSQLDTSLPDTTNQLTHWPVIDASKGGNDFGFNALPAGFRFADGSYFASDNNAYWWTSSEYSTQSAWIRGVTSTPTGIARFGMNKSSGFSIRCVREVVSDDDNQGHERGRK